MNDVINLEGVEGATLIMRGRSGDSYRELFSITPVDAGAKITDDGEDLWVVECNPGKTEDEKTGDAYHGYWVKAVNKYAWEHRE
jgi:hypothetical protein